MKSMVNIIGKVEVPVIDDFEYELATITEEV